MRIIDKLKAHTPAFSFEFFPPKDVEGVERLLGTAHELKAQNPTYVSVTYGAGGSTRRLTVELVERIKREIGIETMAHLTCVGATRADAAQVLDQLKAGGIRNVLPLRGDPPRGTTKFEKVPGGFGFASELVAYIREHYDFCLAGACYPEKHPEAVSRDADLAHLKRKVEAGVDFLITQLFFDNSDYFDFVARARAVGIDVPIVAGIMPITNLNQVKRFTTMCGSSIPSALLAKLEAAQADPEAVRAIGVEHASEQCRGLVAGGVPGIHFYTLNRSTATLEILRNLRSH
ncbi:MAG TPA: methylenetetrahydrofolate reductase [NAD(P)H] [Polyangiaceae bacterium]|nr:methylenetetrahydrofolate reductase [NAD(P)H] [Polyangiaceae bacterium]